MYIRKVVSGTETTTTEFIDKFVRTLAALSDKFIESKSAESDFYDTLTIDSKYRFVFSATTSELYMYVTFSVVWENNLRYSNCNISFRNVADVTIYSCSAGFVLAENESCINLKFLNYRQTAGTETDFSCDHIFAITKNDIYVFAYTTSSNKYAIEKDIIGTADSSAYKTQSRLNYIASNTGTDIDVSTSKILLSGTQKVDEIIGMKDCSTVTANGVYPCNDGKQYYALNANTLMEV